VTAAEGRKANGARPLDPLADRRFRQIHVARDGADGLALVEHKADDAGFELVSELAARTRFGVLAIGLDIVSPTGKMSTDSDHAHTAS